MNLNIGTKDPVNKILWDEAKAVRASGGFSLATSVLNSGLTVLEKGAPIAVDYTARTAKLVKTAKVITGGDATHTRISKKSAFKVGDVFSGTVGAIAVAITAIDTSNAAYDILTHLTVTTAIAADTIIFEATEAGATSTYLLTANALLNDNTKIVGTPTVTAVISAWEVLEANLTYPLSAAIKTALSKFQFV